MYLKVLLTCAILFCSNIMPEMVSDESNIIAAYRKLIINKNDNDNEFTNFCIDNNKETTAYICDRALEQIRKNYPYSDVYLYPNHFGSNFECLKMSVELEKNSVETQYMKSCPSGSVIPDPDSSEFINTNVMVSAITPHNIFAFKRDGSENNYQILSWFREAEPFFSIEPKPSPVFAENRVIPKTLFQQKLPNSLHFKEGNIPTVITSLIPPRKLNKKNIVNKSDADTFAKLCIMSLRRSKYPDVIVDLALLGKKEPPLLRLPLKIDGKYLDISLHWCPVKRIQIFPNAKTLKDFSNEEAEKLKNALPKPTDEFTLEQTKKILNLDEENFYRKINKIWRKLTIYTHPTDFYLSQGPIVDSLLLIKGTYKTLDRKHLENVSIELIQDISDDYVNRIDLNSETQFLKILKRNQNDYTFEKRYLK